MWAGLRFDSGGRLWAMTGRGSGDETVFDVFDRSLNLVGEVRVNAKVTQFAFGGPYLATAGSDGDGVPQVVLWRVK